MTGSLVCILMLLASGSQAYNSIDSERYIKAFVDVFNGLFVDDALYFYTDFGSASTLLHGNAEVKLGGPIQLLSTSKEDLGNMTLRYTARMKSEFEILIPPSGLWWTFRGCSVELKYDVTRVSSKGIGHPFSLSVVSCSIIEPGHGPIPDHPEQILPVLANGLLSAAKEHLSIEGDWTTSVDGFLRSRVVGELMKYAVSRLAPDWLPPQYVYTGAM